MAIKVLAKKTHKLEDEDPNEDLEKDESVKSPELVCISDDDDGIPMNDDAQSDDDSSKPSVEEPARSDDNNQISALDHRTSSAFDNLDQDDECSRSELDNTDNESIDDLLNDSDNEELVKILDAGEAHLKKQSKPIQQQETSSKQQDPKPLTEKHLFEDDSSDFESEQTAAKSAEPEKVKPPTIRQGPILMDALPQPYRRAFNRSISEQTVGELLSKSSKQGSKPSKKVEPTPKYGGMFQKKAPEVDRPKSRTEQVEERKQRLREVAEKGKKPEKAKPTPSGPMGVMKSSQPKNKKLLEVIYISMMNICSQKDLNFLVTVKDPEASPIYSGYPFQF